MSERPLDKHELLCLLGNCILALSLSEEEEILATAKAAAEHHVEELDERFPEWREEAKAY
jgi:hypothetical protein